MKKYLVGFLTLVILVSSVYIMLPENVRIDVGNTYSTFKVWENGSWVTSGKEYTKLYDGTKLMRAKSRVVNYTIENNNTTIYRYAYFKDDIFAIDTYEFDGNVKDLELIPISHTIRILNAKDKIFHYEIRDILYNGETKNIVSPFSFGHNMQIEWESGNYYSKVFQQIVSDKIIVKYRPTSNDETYSVRLFDPVYSSGTITYDGDYTIHTFTTNGYFNVSGGTLNVSVLVIAGGGAGGSPGSGGGAGAGGYIYDAGYNVTEGNYDIVVGNGGSPTGADGTNGQNSSFDGLVAWGGGYGASIGIGGLGGSGGGGGGFSSGTKIGGLGIVGQGHDGGNGYSSGTTTQRAGGGGGGAGFVGTNATISVAGDGGNGTTFDIYNGTALWYAGGGGGSSYSGDKGEGGLGGGGTGDTSGINGTGGGGSAIGGHGGSGIVIIRFLSLPSEPIVTLETPTNDTNSTTNEITFNCTALDYINLVNVSLMLDGVVNETNSSGLNNSVYSFTKILAEGDTYWTCEGCNNVSSCFTAEKFLLNVDTILPIINITYPLNDSYIINVSDLNYTIIETNPSYCWYSNNSGEINSSLQICMTNWTDVLSIEGQNTWIIYSNDTAGNENQTSITFNKETANPLIDFESETEVNGSAKNNTFIYANVSVTEANEQNITYELYFINGTLINSSYFTNPIREINWTGLNYGTYLYNVTVFDTLSNSNSTETRTIYLSNIFLFFDGNEETINVELNTTVNITGNSSIDFGLVCLDIDHPDYGYNYTCGNQSVSVNLTFDYFRKTSFWNDVVSRFFNFSFFQVDDENLTIETHQYAEAKGLSVNISSDDVEDLVFYVCNTTNIDRAYNGFLVGENIYLNKSINSAETEFSTYNNLTFANPGNQTIYFYLDDNATIKNITMNVTGKNYGFDYFDEFTTFGNISVSETNVQLHYGPGGFIQAPNSSLSLRTFDDFNDASIADHWTYSGTQSGAGYAWGVRETGGYLEAYAGVEHGYSGTVTKAFYPRTIYMWFYTSDYLSFNLKSYYYGSEGTDYKTGCIGTNTLTFADQTAWESSRIDSMDGGNEESNADLNFELRKINNTYWEVNISGTQTLTTDGANDCDGTGNVVRTYDYDAGTITTNWADPDCTDTVTSLKNSSFMLVDEDKVMVKYSTYIRDDTYCNGANSYLRLDNLKNKMWYRDNGTIISKSIFDSSSNIVSSTMNYSGYANGPYFDNYTLQYYMSADNGNHWESITDGVLKTFNYPGKHLKWKIDFNTTNPGYHNVTAYIENVTVEIEESSALDLEFDFGNDGIWDFKINGTLNESNNTQLIWMDADISNSFTDVRSLYDHLYRIPLRISSNSSGQINLNVYNITYNPNPVILNHTGIQEFIDTYGSNETNFTIPLGGTNGSVNVSDIRYDYAGGNKTYEVLAHTNDYSANLSRNITVYSSNWDYTYPPNIEYIDFFPWSPTAKNVTPFGQTNSVPMFNVSGQNYGGIANFSVYMNDSLACVNVTFSTTNSKTDGELINSSWYTLDEQLIYEDFIGIWMWADYGCSYTDWQYFNPYYYLRACQEDSLCSEDLT